MSELEKCHKAISDLHSVWLPGSSENIISTLPESWQACVSGHNQQKQHLFALALASQFQFIMEAPQAPGNITTREPLPVLKYPTLIEKLRPLFRRLRSNHVIITPLLQLMADRGYCAHPADWMPSARDESLPAIYWPWCRWVANNKQIVKEDEVILCEETWNDFFPAERLSRLRQLRFEDPTAARNLIASCAVNEPADKRLKLVDVLANNLNSDDAEFLESLSQDRSQKVAALAKNFLVRIGKKIQYEGDMLKKAEELAEEFELKKVGLLKKALHLVPKKLKNNKQKAIRSDLLANVSSAAFAQTLELSVEELSLAWQYAENRSHDNFHFLTNLVQVLKPGDLPALIETLLEKCQETDELLLLLRILLPHLEQQQRQSLMLALLKGKSHTINFETCLEFCPNGMQNMSFSDLMNTPAWRKLHKILKSVYPDQAYLEERDALNEIQALGLMVNQKVADELLAYLVNVGMLRADPALDCLSLNSQLLPE